MAKQVTETNNSNQTINRVKNPQLAGGKPAGYLQAWSRIWTREDCDEIQLAVRTRATRATRGLRIANLAL